MSFEVLNNIQKRGQPGALLRDLKPGEIVFVNSNSKYYIRKLADREGINVEVMEIKNGCIVQLDMSRKQ